MEKWYCGTEFPGKISPLAWFEQVLTRPLEMYQAQYDRARRVLAEGGFSTESACFVHDVQGPAGLLVFSGAEEDRQIEIVAVRQDRRRQKLGMQLMQRGLASLRQQGVRRVMAAAVSSGNAAAVGLLEACGFVGTAQGSLRMRRSLMGPLPPVQVPEGFVLRALLQGEEAPWVQLKNACFPESAPWTLVHFQQEFVEAPFFDRQRIFVAMHEERMVGTVTAWEIDVGEGPVGLIHWVGTHPDYRGRGLGAALNARALQELVARGYVDAWLNTSRDRVAAVQLYEKQGFVLHRALYRYTLELDT